MTAVSRDRNILQLETPFLSCIYRWIRVSQVRKEGSEAVVSSLGKTNDFGKEGGVCLPVPPLVSSSVAINWSVGKGSGKKARLASQSFSSVHRSPGFMNWVCLAPYKANVVFFQDSFQVSSLRWKYCHPWLWKWGAGCREWPALPCSLPCMLSKGAAAWCLRQHSGDALSGEAGQGVLIPGRLLARNLRTFKIVL